MRYADLLQKCLEFEKLAQEFKAPKVPLHNPYESGERPVIRHLPEPEIEAPKTFEIPLPKPKGMVISREQALEEVIDNGLDPDKFLEQFGKGDFYKAREVLMWIMDQEQ
jgi:hypothetical protein